MPQVRLKPATPQSQVKHSITDNFLCFFCFCMLTFVKMNLFKKLFQEHYKSVKFCLFVWFDSLRHSQQFFSYAGTCLPGLNQYKARINVSCTSTEHSDPGEAWTFNPSVSSQALYHWVTSLAQKVKWFGSRSGPTLCWSWCGSKLFAKVISR